MSDYAQRALQTLKSKGLRITHPRQRVVALLDAACEPLSAYDIAERLEARGEKVDTVSIYRILECLADHHLIHRVLGTGKVLKCVLGPATECNASTCGPHHHTHDHCHHLLICQHCHSVAEVPCPDLTALKQYVERVSAFRVKTHQLEFWGLCAQCQAASPPTIPLNPALS